MSELLEKMAKEKENIKKQQAENLEEYRKESDKLRDEIRKLEEKKKKLSDFLDESLADKFKQLETEIEKAKQQQLDVKSKKSELKKSKSDHDKDVQSFDEQKIKDEEDLTYRNKELAERSVSVSTEDKLNKAKSAELSILERRTKNKEIKINALLLETSESNDISQGNVEKANKINEKSQEREKASLEKQQRLDKRQQDLNGKEFRLNKALEATEEESDKHAGLTKTLEKKIKECRELKEKLQKDLEDAKEAQEDNDDLATINERLKKELKDKIAQLDKKNKREGKTK